MSVLPEFARLICWKDGGPVYLTRDGRDAVVTQRNAEFLKGMTLWFYQGHIGGVPHEWHEDGCSRTGTHADDIKAAKLALPDEPEAEQRLLGSLADQLPADTFAVAVEDGVPQPDGTEIVRVQVNNGSPRPLFLSGMKFTSGRLPRSPGK